MLSAAGPYAADLEVAGRLSRPKSDEGLLNSMKPEATIFKHTSAWTNLLLRKTYSVRQSGCELKHAGPRIHLIPPQQM